MPTTASIQPLDRTRSVYIAGHRGLVGSALWRKFHAAGFTTLIGRTSQELDLRDRQQTARFFDEVKPDYVVLAAARVGGIAANDSRPVDFLTDNLQIQTNVLDAALEAGVERLLFLGSSCIYPRNADQPIVEESLMTGHLEPTNQAYAVAKIAGIAHVQAVRRQYGRPWISAMPTNLYGPGDNFSAEGSHVLPALIRRYDTALHHGDRSVMNWGSGAPRREFMHVDDMASACLHLLDHYNDDIHVNVGTGSDLPIRDVAELVADAIGYDGVTQWDTSRPDGTPRKLLDVSRLTSLGWEPRMTMEAGLAETVAWYREHRASVRQ